MLCQSCYRFTSNRLVCEMCRTEMRPASERLLTGGVRVVGAFEHSGPARALAHHLKYRGMVTYADLVARVVAEKVSPAPLVPVARAWSRRARYGLDPAGVLANSLAKRLDVPVWRLLRPPIHAPRRAGGDHTRPVHLKGLRKRTLEKVILVDDVLTTGATLEAAVSALGANHVRAAVVANAVPETVGRLERSQQGSVSG